MAYKMKNFIAQNWELLLGFLGTAGAFFGAWKIRVQNGRAAELENIKTVREMEKTLLDDMKKQVDDLIGNCSRLEIIIKEQAKTIRKYEQKFGEL